MIGTAAGGSGNTLTITLNAAASAAAIEALVENLAYANVSGTPTGSREFSLDVFDSLGGRQAPSEAASFAVMAGAASPFNAINVSRARPALLDITGDGLLDLVVGRPDTLAPFLTYTNTGTGFVTGPTLPTGNLLSETLPSAIDVNGDGLLDLRFSSGGVSSGRPLVTKIFLNTESGLTDTNDYNVSVVSGLSIVSSTPQLFFDVDQDGLLDAVAVDLSVWYRKTNTGYVMNGTIANVNSIIGTVLGTIENGVYPLEAGSG